MIYNNNRSTLGTLLRRGKISKKISCSLHIPRIWARRLLISNLGPLSMAIASDNLNETWFLPVALLIVQKNPVLGQMSTSDWPGKVQLLARMRNQIIEAMLNKKFKHPPQHSFLILIDKKSQFAIELNKLLYFNELKTISFLLKKTN